MDNPTNHRVLHKGRFLQFAERNGWEYLERHSCTGVAVIVPVTAAGELVLITQYRAPVNAVVIELPAGLVNDEGGDTVEMDIDAARRELLEETGVDAPIWRVLGKAVASPGISGEIISFFAAEGGQQVEAGGGVAGENIEIHLVPMDELDQWLLAQELNGAVVSAIVHSGLQMYRTRNHHPELL